MNGLLANVVFHENFKSIAHLLHLHLHILKHAFIGEGARIGLSDLLEDALAYLIVNLADLRPVLVDLIVYVVQPHENALPVITQHFEFVR